MAVAEKSMKLESSRVRSELGSMDARTCMVLHGLRTAVVEANISANDVGRRNFVPELEVTCKVRRGIK